MSSPLDIGRPRSKSVRAALFGAIALLAGATSISGCKKSFTPTIKAADFHSSCDARTLLSQCTDFANQAITPSEKFVRGPCDAMHAAYSNTPCPSEGLVGSCEIGGVRTLHFYKDGPNLYEETRAKRECEVAQGGWFAPN